MQVAILSALGDAGRDAERRVRVRRRSDRARVARRIAVSTVAALLSLPGYAQMATFRNFRHYPPGEWRQELVGYRDDKPLGPLVTSTTCSSPLDPNAASAFVQAARDASSSCTTRTLTDEERMLEFETACKVASGVQTMRMQVRAIDDRTLATEMRSTLAGTPETLLKGKVTYLGACPAGAATAAKPTAADCAELAKMREDNEAAGGAAQCAQMPPQHRAQCEAQMASGTKAMAAIERQCR